MKVRKHFVIFVALTCLLQGLTFAQTDTLVDAGDSSLVILQAGTPEKSDKQQKSAFRLTTQIDSTDVQFFFGTLDSLKSEAFHEIDTSTLYFQQYDPLFHQNGVYSTLSNIGLAHKNFAFTPALSVGYQFENIQFARYSYTNSQVKYYKLFVPFSEIQYVLGSKKEQTLSVLLNREIFKGFSIGLDISVINSPGPYERSKSNDKKYYFTTQYYTPNKRYGLVANYLRNKIVVEENGGIRFDSVFEDNVESNRRIIPIILDSSNARNRITESGMYIEQYFNLLKPKSTKDSVKRKIDAGNISWAFQFRQNKRIYNDDNPLVSFYQPYAPPIDSSATYDSLFQQLIHNRIKWSSIGYNDDALSKVFFIYFGADHDNIQQLLPYDSVKTTYNQITPFGGISLKLFKSSHLTADGRIVLGGYNNGDYRISAKLDQFLGTSERNIGELHFGLNMSGRTPSWFYSEYQSNRFRWKNDLKKETIMVLSGAYQFKALKAGVDFSSFTNFTYLNDSVKPEQIGTPASVLKIYVKGNLPIGKFGINTRLVYQTTSKPEAIRLPDFFGVMDLYFKSTVFKKAGTLQTGFQFNYFTLFYADAYMPELRAFHIQNEKKIGNYVFADFYVTLQVKTARLFFKAANLTSYLGNYTYYLAPHYPARDARFYFGISWRFHD
ncbi:MAG: putative porin [Bacteroidales bacterium]|nr:putative porin [Bacteroidales bacterium]